METALAAHLDRLTLISATGIAIGALIWWRVRDERWRAFGWMTLAWSAIDLLIALSGRRNVSVPDPAAFREFLAFNAGLDLGYLAVGIALACFPRPTTRGAGWAVALQGLLLFSLDVWLWKATR